MITSSAAKSLASVIRDIARNIQENIPGIPQDVAVEYAVIDATEWCHEHSRVIEEAIKLATRDLS